MGGGKWAYPKEIWTPYGGWWPDPVHWKRNTAMCLGLIVAVSSYSWSISSQLETRHQKPEFPIPSRYWNSKLNKLHVKEEEEA